MDKLIEAAEARRKVIRDAYKGLERDISKIATALALAAGLNPESAVDRTHKGRIRIYGARGVIKITIDAWHREIFFAERGILKRCPLGDFTVGDARGEPKLPASGQYMNAADAVEYLRDQLRLADAKGLETGT